MTSDRGKELSDHRLIYVDDRLDGDFCDPQSPWQAGSNENTNGLLKRYFPTGTDLSVSSPNASQQSSPSAKRTVTQDLELGKRQHKDLTLLRRLAELAANIGHWRELEPS